MTTYFLKQGACKHAEEIFSDPRIQKRLLRLAKNKNSGYQGMDIDGSVLSEIFNEAILDFVPERFFPCKSGYMIPIYALEEIDRRFRAVEYSYGVIK